MNRNITDTNGYSPEEVLILQCDPFGEQSLLQLKSIPEEVCEQIPLFRQIYRLLEILYTGGEIKLTQKGNLPLKIVTELSGFGISQKLIEDGYAFRSEMESISVPVAREVALLIGARSRNATTSCPSPQRARRYFATNLLLPPRLSRQPVPLFRLKRWIGSRERNGRGT